MYAIDEKLKLLQKNNNPIKVGLIGVGQMGKDILAQVDQMEGIEVIVAVDLSIDTVIDGYSFTQNVNKIIETEDLNKAEKATTEGKVIATTNYRIATRTSQLQVIIDATGSPEMGAQISWDAINNKKHIVMMNVECDVTIGPILSQLADNAGVIYTLSAGDEPGAIMEIYRFAKALGFKIVAAGKGKNNPLDIYATPDMLKEKAKARNMNPYMLVEFVDGSKTMVEMAAVSNATGLVPDVRGMHGPNVLVKDLTKVFCRKDQGGILNKDGVVDYAIGDVHPGIFLIVSTDNPRIVEGLIQRDMGSGPNYLLYRPYHLCSIETPLTAAQAVLYNEATMQPLRKILTAECITVAKNDLNAGTILDRIGGDCYRGSIELATLARKEKMLPLGLAEGTRLRKSVKKDEIITYNMVEFLEDSLLLKMREMQDKLFS